MLSGRKILLTSVFGIPEQRHSLSRTGPDYWHQEPAWPLKASTYRSKSCAIAIELEKSIRLPIAGYCRINRKYLKGGCFGLHEENLVAGKPETLGQSDAGGMIR